MLLIIDNYDSFTYNLAHYFAEIGARVNIIHNDAVSVGQIASMMPAQIVISPGPGNPDESGVSLAVIDYFAGRVPILGVCLGHQALGQAFGAKVVNAAKIMHGKISKVRHSRRGLFQGVANPLQVTRYHSLVLEHTSLPQCFKVTAWTEGVGSEIMAIEHRQAPLFGVQFHPESIMTEQGHKLLQNFLKV